jgi:cell wall-associated NlpC family hydrolase
MYSTPFNTLAYSDPATPRPLPLAWFVGIPFLSGGRDPARGLDCWGLALAVARECFALELPDYRGYTDADDVAQTGGLFENRDQWQRVDAGSERGGDVIVMRLGGTPAHAALVVDAGLMIHTLAGRDSCIERYGAPQWARRLEGFYRWQPR